MAEAGAMRRYVRRIAAFASIGAFNTVAFFLISTGLFQWAGLSAIVAGYVAYAVLVPVSFFGHRRITFSSDGAITAEWVRFCWVSFALISVLIPALNFVIFQLWVFSGRTA